MSGNQQFILDLIKQMEPIIKTALPAVLTYLVGLHQKQPGYMTRESGKDEK